MTERLFLLCLLDRILFYRFNIIIGLNNDGVYKMKKYFVLLLLIFSTGLFAEEPTVSAIETIYILEGPIDDKASITLYLNIESDFEENTKTVSGKYYYNNIGDFFYLGESVLENTSTLTLKAFSTSRDAYRNTNSIGEFKGTFSDDSVFKGRWKSVKNSFDFELKPRDTAVIQEIEITKYSFSKKNDFYPVTSTFEFNTESFQIANPKKISSIEKLNKELSKLGDFDDEYSSWKKILADEIGVSYTFITSYDFIYADNRLLSLEYQEWSYTGGAHGNGYVTPIIYSLGSGKILDKRVDDLISNGGDDKLILLMRQKLKEGMINMADTQLDENQFYFDFETIRLNNNYSIDDSGVTFIYNQYEIAPYSSGIISIKFRYDELKPFVKKTSPLWYLFEKED